MTKTQIVQNLFIAYGKQDVESVLNAMTDDITWLEPGDPSKIPFSGNFSGKNGVLQMFGIEAKLLQMTSFTPTAFFENDNAVAVLGSDSAIVKETGNEYKTDFVMVFSFTENLISSVQVYMDTLAIASAFEAKTSTAVG